MTVNRKISPPLSELSIPKVLPYTVHTLPNGMEVILLNDPEQDVFKMDIVFNAGVYYQKQPLVATTAINMLNEGTTCHNSAEIAEIFDYYGACVYYNSGMNKAELNLLSLNKFAEKTISLLAEILSSSIIPAHELEIYLCHMVMFRVVERLHLENYISDSNLNYVVTSVLTICLAICFAYCVQRGLDKLLLKKIA